MRLRRPFLAAFWLLAAVFVSMPTRIHASKPSSSLQFKSQATLNKLQQQSVHPHVVIYETEVLDSDDEQWKGASPSRWTSDQDEECSAPIHTEPPPDHTWDGEWKIVMSPQTNQLGWQSIGKTKRRRMWLRSILVTEQDQTAVSTTTATPTTRRKRQVSLYSILSGIRDDWNFKGFGWSLYKSLIFLESFGFSFRIPLSQNVGWWERHQIFPSISSSIGVYYPPTLAFFLSISANVDYLKWCLQKFQYEIRNFLRLVVAGILRVLLLLILSRQQQQQDKWQAWLSSLHSSKDQQQSLQGPYRHVEISERIGMSVSWRISKTRGYEFRISYWHSYLPTILYIHSLLPYISSQKLPMEYWLRRRTSSLGLSTSGPTPSPPHFSCSACLSLSGFHYNSILSKRNIAEETISVLPKDRVKNKVISSKMKDIGKVQQQQEDSVDNGDENTSREARETKGGSGVKQVAG